MSDDLRDRQFEISNLKVPPFNARAIRIAVIVLLAAVAAMTTFYTVGPEENGLVLVFGRYVRSTDPGLHFKIPFGVERVLKVPVQRQLKEEFGFRTVRAGSRSQQSNTPYRDEANILTGDLNAAVVEWVVQYRVVDPYKYLFRVRNVRDTFRDINEAVMREIVGDRTVNEVLTVGRAEVALQVQTDVQLLCDQYETGIKVEQVVLQDVNPPDQVKPSFNEVNEAQQERAKLINQAQSEYNQIIPRARGEALQTVREAEGYALERINHARGDSARFVALYGAYAKAPEVTKQRLFLETMSEILPKVERKVIVDAKLTSVLPLLNLDASKGGGP
jgi:membrane protease subunit HflK